MMMEREENWSELHQHSMEILPNFAKLFHPFGIHTFQKSLPAPGKPQRGAKKIKLFICSRLSIKLNWKKKTPIHSKIRISQTYHHYFVKRISFVTLGILLNFSGPQFPLV